MDLILSFKRTFYNINNRDALDSEIIDNLKDMIEPQLLLKIIDQLKKTAEMSDSQNSIVENMV
jgi:hypothetical protein